MVVSSCSGRGRLSSLQELRMACLQMELPMLIDVVMYVVYCVTVWLGGGCVMRIVCCNAWRSSASLSSPHELRWSFVLLRGVPLWFVACHGLGRWFIRARIFSSDESRAFTSWLKSICGLGRVSGCVEVRHVEGASIFVVTFASICAKFKDPFWA